MGTILVAYGEPDNRDDVLEFAVEQAAASDYDLLVYHVQEADDESLEQIRVGIEQVIERTGPDVTYEIEINERSETSDQTNISKQKRLTDAILDAETDYEYVVMGDVERNTLEGLAHASMTKAVLDTHAVPVLLVPVRNQ